MKVFHTSDWHLGHLLYKQERTDEFRYAIDQVVEMVSSEHPDVFVLSGDVFDVPAPSNSAQELFTTAMLQIHAACPSMPIVVIAGNHDGKAFIDVNRSLWKLAGVRMVGLLPRRNGNNSLNICERYDIDEQVVHIPGKGYVVAVPHVYDAGYPLLSEDDADARTRREQYFKALLDAVAQRNTEGLPVVLMAHLAISASDTSWHDFGMVGGLCTTDQSEFGSNYDYLALGHIHQPQTMVHNGRIARYCGSLIPISFSEESAPHSVSIVEVKAGATTESDIRTIEIAPLRPLRTIPDNPVPFDQALQHLEDLPCDAPCYVRLNVVRDVDFPGDAMAQAIKALDGKDARFCEFKCEESEALKQSGQAIAVATSEELGTLSEMDVALRSAGGTLPEAYVKMLTYALEQLAREEENNNNE